MKMITTPEAYEYSRPRNETLEWIRKYIRCKAGKMLGIRINGERVVVAKPDKVLLLELNQVAMVSEMLAGHGKQYLVAFIIHAPTGTKYAICLQLN
jgi:hypothetical protein